MPKGPRGEKRPGDVNSCAAMVVKIATGEVEEDRPSEAKRNGGLVGGKKRAEGLTPERRREIAQAASAARWG
jgi:hypothetical protein